MAPGSVSDFRARPEVAHRFHTAAAFAFVEPPPSWVVVPRVPYGLVLRPHHALLTPAIFGQISEPKEGKPAPPKAFIDSYEFWVVFDLVIAGVLLVFVGLAIAIVSLIGNSGHAEVKGAGVILIGPVPIVIGSDAKWASVAIALTIVLVVLAFGLHLV